MQKSKIKIIKEFLPLVFIILASVFFIFYQYSEIPKGLAHDENELARVAFSLEDKPYTPFTPVADGHGTPYFYILLLSFKIFGVNQFALRLPSRIFGILSIVFFYLICKEIFPKKQNSIIYYLISIILPPLLLTSRWFLNFSRFSFEMPFLLCLELISIYFFVFFIHQKKDYYLIFSGIFAGIAYNSYQPGRIFFLLPLIGLLIYRVNAKKILSFIIPFIVFIFPMSFYLMSYPTNDIRINQQLFLKNNQLSWQKKAEFFGDNIQKTFLMFFIKGDSNGRHNYPYKASLNPILGGLFALGLIYAVKKIKNPDNLFFLLYFCLAVIPTIFTYPWENPNMLRTYTALPAVVYFIGITSQVFFGLLNKLKNKTIIYYLLSIIYCFLLVFSSFYEMRTYFKYQSLVFKQAFDKPDNLKLLREKTINPSSFR